MIYNLPNGGHAPGYLRDEFLEALEADVGGRPTTPENDAKLRKLSGRLWICTDQTFGRRLHGDSLGREPDLRRP